MPTSTFNPVQPESTTGLDNQNDSNPNLDELKPNPVDPIYGPHTIINPNSPVDSAGLNARTAANHNQAGPLAYPAYTYAPGTAEYNQAHNATVEPRTTPPGYPSRPPSPASESVFPTPTVNQKPEPNPITTENNIHHNFTPQSPLNSPKSNNSLGKLIGSIVFGVIILACLRVGLFWDSGWAIFLFWFVGMIAFKINSNLRWLVTGAAALALLIKFQLHPIALGGLVLVGISTLFLSFNPTFGNWTRYMASLTALILGLLVAVPMSMQGNLNYVVNQYQNGGLFTKSVDAAYQTLGSPELSPAKIELNFKRQISGDISQLAAEKASGSISPEDGLRLAKLCEQVPDSAELKNSCSDLNRENLEKMIEVESKQKIEAQADNVKNVISQTPQLQFATNLIDSTTDEQQAFLSSRFYIPTIILLIVYLVLSGLLITISWPLRLLVDRVSLD